MCADSWGLGEELGLWKESQGSHGKRSLRHEMCALYCTIENTQMGEVEICLEFFYTMTELALPPLATTSYTKGMFGSCHHPEATNTAIWTKRPACPLLVVWAIKALQCSENIFLDREDVNTAVYEHCQPTSSRGEPQTDLSGCRRILEKKYWSHGRLTFLLTL